MWTIFKVFIEFVTILLLCHVFGGEACGNLAPQPGIEPAPLALEGKVLTTDFQGSPITVLFLKNNFDGEYFIYQFYFMSDNV